MPHDARTRLAARQAELLAALCGAAAPPAGFDANRIRATVESLATKRCHAVARAWPDLSHALGPQFSEYFTQFAKTSPIPRAGGALADGRAFARWLAAHKLLPEAARLHVLAVDLRFAHTGQGLVPRRGAALRFAILRTPCRLFVGLRLPWLGVHCLIVRLGRCPGG